MREAERGVNPFYRFWLTFDDDGERAGAVSQSWLARGRMSMDDVV